MITQIRMTNFRGVAERTLNFGPGLQHIEGPNESGKSTIKEAIAFCYYGCDSSGGKNPDHLIQTGSDATVVAISTEKATLVRKKKRGGTSTVELRREGAPDIKMNQTELTKLLGMEFDLFASCFDVGYFMRLPNNRKMAVINAASPLDRKALFTQALPGVDIPWSLIKLVNPLVDADSVARERRMLANQHSANAGAVRELDAQLSAPTTSVTREQCMDLEMSFNQLKGKVDVYESYLTQARDYRVAYTRYQAGLAAYESDMAKRKRIQAEIAAIGSRPKYDHDEWLDRSEALKAEVDKVREGLLPTPKFNGDGMIQDIEDPSCPRCGQVVSDKLKSSIKAEREAAVTAFNKLAREVEDNNQRVRNEIAKLEGQIKLHNDNGSSARAAQALYDSKLSSWNSTLYTLPAENAAPPVPPSAPSAPWSEEEHQGNVNKLNTVRGQIEAAKIFMEKSAGLQSKRDQLVATMSEQAAKISHLETIEGVLKRLPQMELGVTLEKINLTGVSNQLVEGELETSVNGVPYYSLSDGRRMKTDFLWCARFQQLVANPMKFYFCDNADLVDSFKDYLPQQTQVFLARVRADLKELQVVQL